MINSIIEAVSVALNGEFGDGYEVHMEELGQGLDEPCFFIFCLNSTTSLFLGRRYLRTNQLCIQYFPETSERQRECNGVAERMLQCLEYVTLDGDSRPLRGTKMKYEVVDDVLHFFVNYNCFINIREQQTPMDELKSNTDMK